MDKGRSYLIPKICFVLKQFHSPALPQSQGACRALQECSSVYHGYS